ncbi:MAG: DUF512 domain-containing protein [Clostridia bacterium]
MEFLFFEKGDAKFTSNKYETSCNFNKNVKACTIEDVVNGSISDEMGIKKGYKLISINGEKIIDILDYKYLTADEYLEIEFENLDNEIEIFEVEKEEYEDLGLVFETELIDKPKNCCNKCIFCFMEQLPKNVRDTLIFKDDDYRLSFFSGNYITMTNMTDDDISRIIKYKVSPINISVHATDEIVRCKMLNNRFAGKVLQYIDRLYKAGIHMNAQIVLCKGINDKEILNKTITDLSKYIPALRCIAIVPVGLSKYRDNLYDLKPLTSEDCLDTINCINKYQKEFKKKYKTNLVYLADEFYLNAKVQIPKYSEYENFENIENGIGMIANFEHEFQIEFKKLTKKMLNKDINLEIKKITILTGKITYEYITEKVKEIQKVLTNTDIEVLYVENTFFGENITVTGLITGKDILNTLNKTDENNFVIIPDVCLKEDEDIFLDDIKLTQIKEKYKRVVISNTSAKSFINKIYKIARSKFK